MTTVPLARVSIIYRVTTAFIALGGMAMLSGCMKFASSASLTSSVSLVSSSVSSDFLSSPFRSSSRSSATEEEQELEEEIEIYTAFWFSTTAPNDGNLLSAIATIAARRGLSDWEDQAGVWTGVGRGLAVAGVSASSALSLALHWARGDPNIVELLERGYDSCGRAVLAGRTDNNELNSDCI